MCGKNRNFEDSFLIDFVEFFLYFKFQLVKSDFVMAVLAIVMWVCFSMVIYSEGLIITRQLPSVRFFSI